MTDHTKYPTSRPREQLGEAYVNKSNALIHASYNLTITEHRLLLAAVAKLDSRRVSLKKGYDQISRVRIYAAEYSEVFGVDLKNAYLALRDGSERLYGRSVKTYDGRVRERFRWIAKEAYEEGSGYVELSFTPDAAQYLTLLKNRFTSYQLKKVSHLKSFYSMRLYEQLMEYQRTGLFRISLEDFCTRLELPYVRWCHIQQRVIEPAVKEIRAKSAIDVDYKAIKVGRSVSMLEFTFTPSAQSILPFELEEPTEDEPVPETP